jgi:hypothetical protein
MQANHFLMKKKNVPFATHLYLAMGEDSPIKYDENCFV